MVSSFIEQNSCGEFISVEKKVTKMSIAICSVRSTQKQLYQNVSEHSFLFITLSGLLVSVLVSADVFSTFGRYFTLLYLT